ncbi:MAG: radical SAM protein [Gemmataceae bacterium]
MALLNLAAWLDCTEAEGPGRRFALWVQGCSIRCPGCCNPHMFDFVPKKILEAAQVIQQIEKAHSLHHLEGVTFLGGEPMLQARGLAAVAQGARRLGLSVMVFTGYTLEQLERMNLPGVKDLLDYTDVLVDGPYRADVPETERNWVGSRNQRFFYFTNRYDSTIEYDPRYRRSVEIRIARDLRMTISGWPTQIVSAS